MAEKKSGKQPRRKPKSGVMIKLVCGHFILEEESPDAHYCQKHECVWAHTAAVIATIDDEPIPPSEGNKIGR